MHLREVAQYYMGQSDQAEDKLTFRGREWNEGRSVGVMRITTIKESKGTTEMGKIGQ